MTFRYDLHALRVLAVLAVLLFHFNIPGFAGGFIGVDVFFVISGFLMTSIIVDGIENNRFSVLKFYWARARRIIPALMAVCAVMLIFGWFWLAPSEYELLGIHSASSLGFISNFIYKGEEGYFDLPSQYKWLLHTWSLAVEWQFYLVYPLVLMASARWVRDKRKAILRAMMVMGIISLAGCIFISPIKPEFSFFILPTRMWEMIAGGMAYLLVPRLKAGQSPLDILAVSGAVMIVLSAMIYHSDYVWPGYYALLPVMGTVLFIATIRQDSVFIRNRIVQNMGDWSYSIYLWHWPVMVAFGYFNFRFFGWQAAGIVLSLCMGALSYYAIECPTRKMAFTRRHATILFSVFFLIMSMSGLAIMQEGFPSRASEQILIADREAENTPPIYKKQMCTSTEPVTCVYGDMDNIGTILWGDSHGGSLVTAIEKATHKGVAYYLNQCPVILNARLKGKSQKSNCPKSHEKMMRYVMAAPKHIPLVIVSRFSAQIHGPNESMQKVFGLEYADLSGKEKRMNPHALYQERLIKTLCHMAKIRPVYVVKPIPEMGVNVPKAVVRQLITGQKPDVSISLSAYNERNDVVLDALETAHTQCGVALLDTPRYICGNSRCSAVQKGRPLYSDDDHLSEFGNHTLIPMFQTML